MTDFCHFLLLWRWWSGRYHVICYPLSSSQHEIQEYGLLLLNCFLGVFCYQGSVFTKFSSI